MGWFAVMKLSLIRVVILTGLLGGLDQIWLVIGVRTGQCSAWLAVGALRIDSLTRGPDMESLCTTVTATGNPQ